MQQSPSTARRPDQTPPRGRGEPRHPEGLRRRVLASLHDGETWQYAIPCLTQLVLVAVLLVGRQWLFALMIGSGAVGTAIALAMRIMRSSPERRAAVTPAPDDDANRTRDDDVNALTCPDLEHLLGLETSKDPVTWRIVVHGWLRTPTLSAPIAMSAGGRYELDLHRQGPHALVAGTTGSGKSVLLQSWCLAMALASSPDDLHFVFMDFKGGSTFSQLSNLPHVVGNVCDLDLQHAVRALLALERELQRREQLVAAHGVQHITALAKKEPELIVVIDEFHALKDQLPDYIDRLVRVASLGRSLGMHIIACTQNPLGQISANMKANMALKVCLRVLDGMQSSELLGTARAASISPHCPGAAFCNDGERLTAVRCATAADADHLVASMIQAHRFMQLGTAPTLFTAPLPAHLEQMPTGAGAVRPSDGDGTGIPFAVGDDGVTLFTAALSMDEGNIAVIGPPGRGKSTLLGTIDRELHRRGRTATWFGRPKPEGMRDEYNEHDDQSNQSDQSHAIWLVDDADALLDPLCADRNAERLRAAMRQTDVTVVFAAQTSRYIRIPEYCTTRVVFPTGERAVDLADGIPSELISTYDGSDRAAPGRGVLMRRGRSYAVQCFAPPH